MLDVVQASHAFNMFRIIKELFGSFAPYFYRFKARTDIDKIVEDFFGAELSTEKIIKTSGVLSAYSCCSSEMIYRPIVPGSATETITAREYARSEGKLQRKVNLQITNEYLSVPVAKLNDIVIGGNKESARIAWLYPDDCTGLIFSPKKNEDGNPPDFGTELKVGDSQKPIPVLLPISGRFDHCLGKKVTVIASVSAADSMMVTSLTESLDQFRISFLSRCLRPFEDIRNCLALDVRPDGCLIQEIEPISTFLAVIGVQGAIEVAGLLENEYDDLFVATVDSIPDRAGMGPLRGWGDQRHPDVYSIISTGSLRWLYHQGTNFISAYHTVDLVDREDTVRKIAELSAHWQAWQKKARKEISISIRRDAKIRPVLLWDSSKAKMFNPGGLQLPPGIERKILSENPGIRKTVDWLRLGTGNS
jgi:hypothetical protein